MIGRIILTFVVLALCGVGIDMTMGDLILPQATMMQLLPSDGAYVASRGIFHSYELIRGAISLAGLLALVGIWYGPVTRSLGLLSILTAIGFCLFSAPEAKAYYASTDYAESFFILPNESAFVIQDVGDNKNGQAKLGSEDYYAANKIAAKRIDIITHTKLPNSGAWSNMYTSSSRVIKVDRTPVAREWVKASHRGTGNKDQSFPCQSSEGHDITVGISIGASVQEDQAPKFLYRFGVNKPAGDPNDPNVVFTSVYYGTSLAQAMDEKVRPRVQALVCDEMTRHTLIEDSKDAAVLMKNIETAVKAYMQDFGMTLDFIGLADTFEFAPEVQMAIDRNFVSKMDDEIAKRLAPDTEVLKQIASATAIRTTSEKWNGALPSSVSLWWLPQSISDAIAKVTSVGK